MQCDERFVEPKIAQQRCAVTGVFAGHHVHDRQDMDRTQGDVGQVADGCRHQVQRARWILLTTRRRGGGLKHEGVWGSGHDEGDR